MIRRLTEKDLKPLRVFFKRVIKDTYEKEGVGDLVDDILDEVNSKIEYVAKDLETNGQSHYFLVYEQESKIIGTSAFVPSGHLIYDHVPELKTVMELGSVLIDPDYQNKGIGTKLVDKTILELKKRYTEFCLDSGYKIAKKIWSKRFGEPIKILEDFWSPGADHYIWHIKFPST